MPQRCQFRNFNNVVLHQLESTPGKIDWFKKIVVWCLCGQRYPWTRNQQRIPDKARKGLCCAVSDATVDWSEVIRNNLNLIFFAVKEYFVWAVQQQPSLRRYLTQVYEWGVYEQEIYLVMNKVREISRSPRTNQALALIDNYLTSFSPNQMKCLRKMFSSKLKTFPMQPDMVYTHEPIISYTTLLAVEEDLSEKVSKLTEWFWLRHLCEEEGAASALEYWNRLGHELKQLFHNFMHVGNIRRNIAISKLPVQYANAQARATVKKYDVALARSDCGNLQQVTNNWFCPTCKRFRGFLANSKSRNRSHGVNISAFGHEKMAINIHDGHVYCVASGSASAAKKNSACSSVPCIRINMLGRFVSFYDTVVTLCTKCASPCLTNVNQDYLQEGMVCCGLCTANRKCPNASFCGYCMHRCTVLREFRMYDDTQRPNKWVKIRLCPKHRKSSWTGRTILLKSLYWHSMENEM